MIIWSIATLKLSAVIVMGLSAVLMFVTAVQWIKERVSEREETEVQ